jgi:putative transposase
MKDYRKASHCVYDIKCHVVWTTKYRKRILSAEIGRRVRDIVRLICTSLDVDIIKGNIRRDHVHLLVSVPPTLSMSRLVQRIKGGDVTEAPSGKPRIEQNILGEASLVPRVFRGKRR